MSETRVQFNTIISNQLPAYVREDYPLISELLKQYYLGQEYQGGPVDLIQNIDRYIKLDNTTNLSESVVLNGDLDFVSSTERVPELIFPGAFNPLHSGHIAMKNLAEKKTGMEVSFEICIQNADKPPLSYHEIKRTIDQFSNGENWVMTKAGMFFDKSSMFPNSVFIIGADTLIRILDEKFYKNRKDMLDKLDLFNSHNINFLVFGRKVDSKFISLKNVSTSNSSSALIGCLALS